MDAAVIAELSEDVFEEIGDIVYNLCGINLHDGKMQLVKARLNKRLRELGLKNYRQYVEYVRGDAGGAEITALLDAISTNLTSFFREAEHFNYLAEQFLPAMAKPGCEKRLRIWSAGCSSGEEPYTIAITAREAIKDLDSWDARILATDLSTKVLAMAQEGIYDADRIEPVAPMVRARSFACIEAGRQPLRRYKVVPSLRQLVTFARLNLMGPWPMKGPFDAIFCRNVMIYFDKETQSKLVNRFWELLRPGGVLFVGHSESLTGVKHKLGYVQPTVYSKT